MAKVSVEDFVEGLADWTVLDLVNAKKTRFIGVVEISRVVGDLVAAAGGPGEQLDVFSFFPFAIGAHHAGKTIAIGDADGSKA